jgi:hypothetical protein
MTKTSILREQVLRLADVGSHLPPGRKGKRLSLSAALRWVLQGVRLPDGQRLHLEAVRVGGKWVTSVEALERFAMAQTPKLDCPNHPAPPRTPGQRRRAAERAAKELEQLGI